MRANHFASAEVERRWRQLQERHGLLRDAASVRRLRLLDAAESQQVRQRERMKDRWCACAGMLTQTRWRSKCQMDAKIIGRLAQLCK